MINCETFGILVELDNDNINDNISLAKKMRR